MKNPKILMFGWEFPPHNSGGLGVACEGLARALVQEGSKVIFVLPKRVPVSSDFMRIVFADDSKVLESLIKFRVIPSLLKPYVTGESYENELRTLSKGEAPIYGGTLAEEVLRYATLAAGIAKEEDFDVIHAHDWLTFLAGIEAKKISGKPLFVHVHATEYDRTGGTGFNEFVYEIEKEGMKAAERVIAISQYTKDIIVRYYGINPEKIDVVHNGIDKCPELGEVSGLTTLKALKDAGSYLVLFLGRLTIQKGPDYFLYMAKKVLDHIPNVIFVMAGSGDMERSLMMKAGELGISDKVFFSGFLRGREREEAYRMADIYIVPSVSEPFGLTVLESMDRGTPVIVSKQSGVSEIVKNALKVDFWDVDEMSNKVISVLRYSALRNHLSDSARGEVENYSWRKAARKCLEIFHRYCFL
jgi:glycogen synthase